MIHPRDALFASHERLPLLPVCDHYAGVEVRMRKSLELQAELGPVFDVTLDVEDGAPVGGELEHALLVCELVTGSLNRFGRVGARLPAPGHAAFHDVAHALVHGAGHRLAYLMVPKVDSVAQWQHTADAIDALSRAAGAPAPIPLHALVETHGALREVQALAAHPRVQSLSFGLMDFVSAHRGAVPMSAMTASGQFEHPLVVRAKLEIAAACHGHAKTPSHCVVTEFKDPAALQAAATRACRQFGYTRMWSIHPNQIRPILEAFAPDERQIQMATKIIASAAAANWAPVSFDGTLHDRASYRHFWQVLSRAHATGRALPPEAQAWFAAASS